MAVGNYYITNHDPKWLLIFSSEQTQICAKLKIDRRFIEHIGSTAVPGLGAKPIIDIMLGLPQPLSIHFPKELRELDYKHDGTESAPGALYCRKETPFRCNLHITEYQGSFWREHIAFRDYLKSHADIAEKYELLKRTILLNLGSDPDRSAYNDAKSNFIKMHTRLALQDLD